MKYYKLTWFGKKFPNYCKIVYLKVENDFILTQISYKFDGTRLIHNYNDWAFKFIKKGWSNYNTTCDTWKIETITKEEWFIEQI